MNSETAGVAGCLFENWNDFGTPPVGRRSALRWGRPTRAGVGKLRLTKGWFLDTPGSLLARAMGAREAVEATEYVNARRVTVRVRLQLEKHGRLHRFDVTRGVSTM